MALDGVSLINYYFCFLTRACTVKGVNTLYQGTYLLTGRAIVLRAIEIENDPEVSHCIFIVLHHFLHDNSVVLYLPFDLRGYSLRIQPYVH